MSTMKASGSSNKKGPLFDAGPDRLIAGDADNLRFVPRGLAITIARDGSNGNASEVGAATMLITVGRPYGGGKAARRFTLTHRGVWLQAAGWGNIAAEVEDIAISGAIVRYAWTAEGPPSTLPLMYVQAIEAGEQLIPDGAARVAVGVADATWTWRTRIGAAAPLDLIAPQLPDGDLRPVLGGAFVASVGNTLSWELEPL
jgi:hypothetical protein